MVTSILAKRGGGDYRFMKNACAGFSPACPPVPHRASRAPAHLYDTIGAMQVVLENGEPDQVSGKQEWYENLINQYI
jgi:hypothetical protein